jgi:hypothetical protein
MIVVGRNLGGLKSAKIKAEFILKSIHIVITLAARLH